MSGLKHVARRGLAVALALVALVLLVTQSASAHARLVKAEPAPGAVLGSAPSQVKLFYDEDVDLGFSDVQVLDKNLARVDNRDLKSAAGDARQLLITLKPLSDGTYTVTWKVLSSTDGHVTRGNFAFSVGNVAGPVLAPVTGPAAGISETDPVSVLVRWLNLLAFLALSGALFFSVLLLERSLRAAPLGDQAEASIWKAWRQLALASLVLAFLTTLAGLPLEASLAGNVPLADLGSSDALPRTLFDTRFGVLWITRVILLAALGATFLPRLKLGRQIGVVLALLLLLTLSLGGHSAAPISASTYGDGGAAAGGLISLPLLADWIHLSGVAIWVGGLFAFFTAIVALRRSANPESRARWIAWMLPRFSLVAIPTAALIALTGLYNSILQVPDLAALIQTAYGETLIVKVALFAVMLAFGAINLLLLTPRFRQASAHPAQSSQTGLSGRLERSTQLLSRFRLTVGAEVLLGASAIFLAGLLTLQPPARISIEEQRAPALASNPSGPQNVILVDQAAPEVQVSLTISPTVETATSFDVYLTNPQQSTGAAAAPSSPSASTNETRTPTNGATTGAPITNVLRVMIQFTLLDQDLGITSQIAESKGNGHYVATGNLLTVPGIWRLRIIVRRAGVEDVAVDFPVFKSLTGASAPVPASVEHPRDVPSGTENLLPALASRTPNAGPGATPSGGGPGGRGPASDPRAVDLLKTSEAAMNQLQSLRSQQDLNDGSNGAVITDYDYHAPNALRFRVRGQAESIAIGPVQYYQDANGNWTERQRVDPFVFPQFNASAQAVNVQLGRADVVNGQDAQVVRYVIPDASSGGGTEFAQWISVKDNRLMQLAMVAPSHFMMQYYMDYDSPQIAISAPANAVRETPAAVAAPAPSTAPAVMSARAKGPITGDLEADIGLSLLVAGLVVGLLASSRRGAKRLRFALLVVSVIAILGSIAVVVDAFNGMAAAAANAPVDTSQAAAGKSLYDNNCMACHGATGHGDGPAGKNLPVQPFDLTTHVLLHDEQYLDAVISNGRGYMPAFKDRLTQDQIFQIIAYARLLARNARQGGAPGFTPGANPGFTPQPGFTPVGPTPSAPPQ